MNLKQIKKLLGFFSRIQPFQNYVHAIGTSTIYISIFNPIVAIFSITWDGYSLHNLFGTCHLIKSTFT